MTDRMFDDPNQLLEQTRALRLLAQRLVGDPHGAEDLVQSTWLIAFHGRTPKGRPLRWLRGILRNLQRQESRSARRRRQREQSVARSESVSDPDDRAEQLETLQAVVEAVRGLPHGYREAVIARYFKNEKPQESARRLAVPTATIHTRLHRAIGLLRESLDRRFGGDRQSWRGSLISITAQALIPAATSGAKLMIATLAAAAVGVMWTVSGILPLTKSTPPTIPTSAQVRQGIEDAGVPGRTAAAALGPRASGGAPALSSARGYDSEPTGGPPPRLARPPRTREPSPVGSPQQSVAPPASIPDDLILLNQRARAWFWIWFYRAVAEDAATRRRLQPALQEAEDAFGREWERVDRDRDLFATYADLRVVFRNVFPYSRANASPGIVEVAGAGETPAYDLRLPRAYHSSTPHRTIVLVPGIHPRWGGREPAQDHFDSTWKGQRASDESIFVIPRVSEEPPLDASLDGDLEQQSASLASVFLPLASAQSDYRLDRERFILDCGKGSSAFGLWMASNFPHFFAGLILRWPVDVSDLRLGSLTGLPVLAITSPETRAAGVELARRLNELEPRACTLLDGAGQYPFPGSAPRVGNWLAGIRRRENPKRVVLEPNTDLYHESFWVRIVNADPLELTGRENRPRLVVEADNVANRIVISANGVTELRLLLNHEIVDLDRPFTVVINGEVTEHTAQPSLRTLTEGIFERHDPTWIFTSELPLRVPRQ